MDGSPLSRRDAYVEVIIMNEFNDYVREAFSAAGDIVIRSMMGGYLVYINGKLLGDICDDELAKGKPMEKILR